MDKELQTLNERIAERVGKDLLDLMPAEEWKKLIDAQIHNYKTKIIPDMIQQILKENLKDDIKHKLSSTYYMENWHNTVNAMTSLAVKDMLKQAAPELFAAMLAPTMSGLLVDLRHKLGQNY